MITFDIAATEVGMAATGAVTGFVVKYFIGFARRKISERKNPICGEYVSEFEDKSDGGLKIIKAPVKIKQSGMQFSGESAVFGKSWELSGKIFGGRYLSGFYQAVDARDGGLGNFFLEIELNGDMGGFWCGYDSQNKSIVSGAYRFKKMQKISIVRVSRKYVAAVAEIADGCLGDQYINAADFLDEKKISVVALVNGKVAGFCIGFRSDISSVLEKIPQLKGENLAQFSVMSSVGLVSSVAVSPIYRGRGVGTALVRHVQDELIKLGETSIVMTGWLTSSGGLHIGSIADGLSYQRVLEIPEFWKQDSERLKYSCPVCGDPPCRCSAVVLLYNHH